MTPADFRLYDFLNGLSVAVSEAPRNAERAEFAWLQADLAAAGLFGPDPLAGPAETEFREFLAAAASDLLAFCTPSGAEYRAVLGNALDDSAAAVLPAMEGDQETVALMLAAARATARPLSFGLNFALALLHRATERMAEAGGVIA